MRTASDWNPQLIAAGTKAIYILGNNLITPKFACSDKPPCKKSIILISSHYRKYLSVADSSYVRLKVEIRCNRITRWLLSIATIATHSWFNQQVLGHGGQANLQSGQINLFCVIKSPTRYSHQISDIKVY